ncbi:TraR/DksA C4-type zinc finger protein [Prosthecobacter sp.]|uniref:TraR/DksA family transcriptional regulator n=1 Tax=Prosthecobacter sp. TaxID=1965333 RepID=UPI0024894B1C|nr:TraR/DksA C4-type zinc finger protein [Prosthecobacter sp.]MDI1311607.1 TraR/DksA C4-type zinc finger protein [Prosthecobacter sp.]
MPAKPKKPAVKNKPAAKPVKKAPVKAVKSKSKPVPAKPAAKSKNKPVPAKAAKPAAKSKSQPILKKAAPQKPAAKKTSPMPVKKTAPTKAAAKAPAPAKKAAAKAAAPAKKAAAKAPAKAEKPAAKPAPAPAPVKTAPVAAVAPAKVSKPSKSTPAPLVPKGRTSVSTSGTPRSRLNREEEGITIEIAKGPVKMTPFLKKQKQRLIELRDAYLNSIEGVASETIRNENGDASAFGMHQADAGSDAYDRDFALSLLGKEQDALYEINEALKRIETGTYGMCEGTGVMIPEERLEAMPFARFSVTYQEKLERSQMSGRWSRPVHSLFGLDNADDASDDDKDDDDAAPSSSNNNSGESLDFSKE